jgi:hypothetical protein
VKYTVTAVIHNLRAPSLGDYTVHYYQGDSLAAAVAALAGAATEGENEHIEVRSATMTVAPAATTEPWPREGQTWWVVDQTGATHVWPTADAAEGFFTTEFQGGSTNLRLGFIMVPHNMSADELADYACLNGFTVVASANIEEHSPDCDLIVYRDGVHTCDCK